MEKLYASDSAVDVHTTDASIQQQQLCDQEKALVKLDELYRTKRRTGSFECECPVRTLHVVDVENQDSQTQYVCVCVSAPSSTSSTRSSSNAVFRPASSDCAYPSASRPSPLQSNLPASTAVTPTLTTRSQLDTLQYRPALALIDTLLTEVHLLESRVYRGIGNFPKAEAALTSSLDLQSGILHAKDKDFLRACRRRAMLGAGGAEFSCGGDDTFYFYRFLFHRPSFDPEDVNALLTVKLAAKYAHLRDLESMRALARAHQDRNLAGSEKVLREYKDGASSTHLGYYNLPTDSILNRFFLLRLLLRLLLVIAQRPSQLRWTTFAELSSDPTIRSHLASLYDNLLEQNLLRIIEPYSVAEIEHVAELLLVVSLLRDRPPRFIARSDRPLRSILSTGTRVVLPVHQPPFSIIFPGMLLQMILDKVFHGVLDQGPGRGCLLVFDQPQADNAYGAAIETLEEVGKVVQSLYAKTVQIA
ncbi:hypothetical protein D9611_013056 [Ephemerocybe angulata]|uniref:PCI domain-containing protein n=1 Tax=Ephemerocybe angulata TaxID=980116 RepID=A0A8H5AVZ9_9AGAR|nr:hypothetical protein D9611_013056 [Tulosesus angulatus]